MFLVCFVCLYIVYNILCMCVYVYHVDMVVSIYLLYMYALNMLHIYCTILYTPTWTIQVYVIYTIYTSLMLCILIFSYIYLCTVNYAVPYSYTIYYTILYTGISEITMERQVPRLRQQQVRPPR